MRKSIVGLMAGSFLVMSCGLGPKKCDEGQAEFDCKGNTAVFCEPSDNIELTIDCVAQGEALGTNLVCSIEAQGCSLCGNGVEDGGEACDDANTANNDFCIDNCQLLLAEICDNFDNDNDGTIDEGCDDDGDGHCDDQISVAKGANICPDTTGGGRGDDCNDDEPTIFGGAHELCDGIDQDCDGLSDLGTDVIPDSDTDETCGALVCLDVNGVIGCGCDDDKQCEVNGGGAEESCDTNEATCFCKGSDLNKKGERGQACDGDNPVFVCSINEDCASADCNNNNPNEQFCK
jgi:hypothetical protein